MSKYIFLTKEYGVTDIKIDCKPLNSAIASISFGSDGKFYNNIKSKDGDYKKQCTLELFDDEENSVKIAIEPKTGYIHQVLD